MKKLLSVLSFFCFVFSCSPAFSSPTIPPYTSKVYQGSAYGLTDIRGIYIDKNQHLWVINFNKNTQNPFDIFVISPANPSDTIVYKGSDYHLGFIRGIVFDENGNAWIAGSPDNTGNNSQVVKIPLSSPGKYVTYSGAAYDFQFFNLPISPIAVDPSGNIWTANGPVKNSVTKIPADDPNSPFVYHSDDTYQIYSPFSVTSDLEGNIWVPNGGVPSGKPFSVLKIPAKNTDAPIIYYDPKYGFNKPSAIAADSQNNIWVLSYGKITEIPEGNPNIHPKLFQSVLVQSLPSLFTTDIKNNIWTTNPAFANLVELPMEYKYPGIPFQFDSNEYSLNRVVGFAPDKLGNIWIANNGNNTITELVRTEQSASAVTAK